MRRCVFFVIGLTLVAMIVVIAAATRLVLMENLLDLERRYLERDVDRVREAVAEDIAASPNGTRLVGVGRRLRVHDDPLGRSSPSATSPTRCSRTST